MIRIVCHICGKEFFTRDKRDVKYCSRACYYKSRIGHKTSEETKAKIGKANKGKPNFFKGKIRPISMRMKLRKSLAVVHSGKRINRVCPVCNSIFKVYNSAIKIGEGKYCSKNCSEVSRLGIPTWNKGKHPEYVQKENHHNWKGGISFEPYSPAFDQQLKDKVRVRDNFKCQLCGVPELECRTRLYIHHIDYNKKNTELSNLISLCDKCHGKTNYKREYWKHRFVHKRKLECPA